MMDGNVTTWLPSGHIVKIISQDWGNKNKELEASTGYQKLN
jgi:hypothetical protein